MPPASAPAGEQGAPATMEPVAGDRSGPRFRRLRTVAGLAALVLFALALRATPARHVFRPDGVRLTDIDAWYHLRVTENLAANFPERLRLDPFALHPGGQWIQVGPMLDYLAAAIAVVLGGGDPSSELVAAVAAWLPAVLGALTVVPLFLLGRRAFGARTGWLAAFFLAFQPGHFLMRSLLGVFDHHVLESLASCLCLWLLMEAAEGNGAGSRARDLLFATAGGLALAAYLLSWSAGVLVPALLAAWVLLCAVRLAWRGGRALACGASTGVEPGLGAAGAVLAASAVALVALEPFSETLPRFATLRFALAALAAGALGALLLELAARRLRLSRRRALLLVLGAAGAVTLVLWAVRPGPLAGALALVTQLRGSQLSRTVSEAKPLLALMGEGPWWRPLWTYYGTTAFVALPGLVGLVLARSGPIRSRLLVVVWTLLTALLTLAQNRFGYYLSLPLALLAAWVCDSVLALADGGGEGDLAPSSPDPSAPRRPTLPWRPRALAMSVVVLLVVYPNLGPALALSRLDASIPDVWRDALLWLRRATPEPFAPGAYWTPASRTRSLLDGGGGYGVLAWWDYGYWIAAVARRPPTANPTQAGAVEAAALLLETDVSLARARLAEDGVRYVLVDGELVFRSADFGGKFVALPLWRGVSPSRYHEVLGMVLPDGSRQALPVFYPEYYRTLLSRLYLFGGRAVEPVNSTFVIEVESGRDVTSLRLFPSEAEARTFVEGERGADRRIVGLGADTSPVALEAAEGFEPVYDSPLAALGLRGVPAIRIFRVDPVASRERPRGGA